MPTMQEVRSKFPQYDDMSDADLASALHRKFYSDIPRAEFDAKIGLAAATSPAQPAAPMSFREAQQAVAKEDRGALAASTLGGSQGATLGFGDELAAGVLAPVEMAVGYFTGEDEGKSLGQRASDAYDRGLELQRTQLRQAQEQHPVATTAGQVAGAVVLPVGKAKTGVGLAAEGAAYGAAAGFGAGETLEERREGAAWGAGLGLGGSVVAQKIGNAVAGRAARASIPETTDLAAASRSLYDAADAAKVTIKAPAFDRAVKNVQFVAGRLNKDLRPKTAGVVEDFTAAAGRDLSLREFDELRQVVNKSLIRAEPQDEMMLGRIKDVMDGFADNLAAKDVTGDIAGVDYLKQARPLWARKSKAELIEATVEKAKNQATGFENGMRVQFRALLNNPKRLKGFKKDEIDAIRTVVRGGPIENTFRAVGWLDPRGTLGAMMAGINTGTTGPVGAAAMAAAGYGSRKTAEAMTRANVRAVEDMVKSGRSMNDIVMLGRQGLGPANVGVQRGERLGRSLRTPLAAILSNQGSTN